MNPAGYLLKKLEPPPTYLSAVSVKRVCSAGPCACEDVVDLYEGWSQNDFGLADSPEQLRALAEAQGQSTSGAVLFYYEVHEQEVVTGGQIDLPLTWEPLTRVPGSPANVAPPAKSKLLGFDIVVFGDVLEHSPLSCQSVAGEVPVNEHCLVDTLEGAKAAINSGAFFRCMEGYYRIVAVYEVS